MNKTVFIGDLHGDLNRILHVEAEYKGWDKVFVGDYVDSYYFTRKSQLLTLEKILLMVEREEAIALMGNHDLGYLYKGMGCSGYSGVMESMLIHLKSKMWKHLKFYHLYKEENLLVTHAGLTSYLWKERGLTVQNLGENLEEWWRTPLDSSPFGWLGRERGGIDPVGGPFWCDFNKEFKPISQISQIFGHTGGRTARYLPGIEKMGNESHNWNIDLVENIPMWFFLEYVDGQFTEKYVEAQIDEHQLMKP